MSGITPALRGGVMAVAVLGAALLPRIGHAQSAMCVEPAFAPAAPRAALAEVPAPPREEDLPWCASADDPRCAPLPGDSTALRLALRQPLAAAAATLPRSTAVTGEFAFTPRTGLVPHAGIRNRVERPPRPIR